MENDNNRAENSKEYEKLMGIIGVLRNIIYVVIFLGAGFTTYYNLVMSQKETNNTLQNHMKLNQIYEKRYESDNKLFINEIDGLQERVRDLEEYRRTHELRSKTEENSTR